MHAEITIKVIITDPAKLNATAVNDYLKTNGENVGSILEASEFCGSEDAPKIEGCLRQIFDRVLPSDCGIVVDDSYASITPADEARLSPTLHLSIAHLRPYERDQIMAALGLAEVKTWMGGSIPLANIHAEHCGLFVKPKEFGFYVRVPSEDETDLGDYPLTDEMRACILLAKSYGAHMIDFDVDEETLSSLETFDDADFIIRNFADRGDDEPLYWNNDDGWGDRDSATRFNRLELGRIGLPTIGADPGFVLATDLTDTRYTPA